MPRRWTNNSWLHCRNSRRIAQEHLHLQLLLRTVLLWTIPLKIQAAPDSSISVWKKEETVFKLPAKTWVITISASWKAKLESKKCLSILLKKISKESHATVLKGKKHRRIPMKNTKTPVFTSSLSQSIYWKRRLSKIICQHQSLKLRERLNLAEFRSTTNF